jgi:Protein of unknown function (DUF4446)
VGRLQSFADQHGFILWLALSVTVLIVCGWIWSVQRRGRAVERHIDDLLGKAASDTFGAMIAEYLGTVRQTADAVNRIKIEHDQMAALMPSVIRHVGLVRFTPFHDTGGNQSFTLALLDSRGDGVVLTGLHSRTDSRLYAKPVERGASSYSLTPEEREAMEQAVHGSPVTSSSA